MNKKQQDKIEKEIEFWKMHLESIDQRNIEITNSTFLTNQTIIIGAFTAFFVGILSFSDINAFYKIFISLVLLLMFNYIAQRLKKEYHKKINHHNTSLIVRERMLRERYKRLGVDKDKLNAEFEDLKNIYNNPKSLGVDFLIEEYYKKAYGEI